MWCGLSRDLTLARVICIHVYMSTILIQMEKLAAFASLATRYSNKWDDAAAMNELDDEAGKLISAKTGKVDPDTLLPIVRLLNKHEKHQGRKLARGVNGILGGALGGAAGLALGGIGAGALAKALGANKDHTGYATMAGTALGGLLGGGLGAKGLRALVSTDEPETDPSQDMDAAVEWAEDINRYRK